MPEKQKRKRQPTHYLERIIVAIVAGMVLSCLLTVRWVTHKWSPTIAYGDEARLWAEYYLRPGIPQTADNVRAVSLTIPGYHLSFYFEIAPDDVDVWLDESNFCYELPLEKTEVSFTTTAPKWWQPEKAEEYVSGACGDNPFYTILIDQSDDETWIVYVEARAD